MSSEKFGRYEMRSELGRGGMATVFHAYDPNFERDVAIKVLPEAFMHDPQFRSRFAREAKMIALLEHPAIVPVYDFGESENQPYIVMRYMSGGTLTERIKQGALSMEETSRILSRLAPALDAAHARGIIHRDLKPGNILFDQYGNAFLSDFGIAHLGGEGMATMTGGSTLGTPAYMSPEQIQGDKNLDGRSDIYALGVLVYQMLTGHLPYSADTPAKTMMMHVLQPVPRILDARPDLPASCDGLILKSMAKDPTERYASAEDMSGDFETILKSGGPSWPAYVTAGVAQAEAGPTVSARTEPPPTVVSATAAATIVAHPETVPRAGGVSRTLIIGGIVVVAIIIVLGGLGFLGMQGSGPFAFIGAPPATQTSAPTTTALPATNTPLLPTATNENIGLPVGDTPTPAVDTPTVPPASPTTTPTITPPPSVIGGADKIAFLSGGNIQVSNLDGSGLVQLTNDGAQRTNLRWLKHGEGLYYIKGKCIETLTYPEGQIDIINCFNFAETVGGFEISPDESQVAISVDNQLYIVPYNKEKISQVQRRSDLTAMAECKELAPFTRLAVKEARWSNDGKQLAMLVFGVVDGKRVDQVQVIETNFCTASPHIVDNFPVPRFTIEGDNKNIENFGFDGLSLFALNNQVRNGGFGDLYVYNMDLHKAFPKINPINNRCCYRDPQFSPDGTYLVFAYQDYLQGSSSLTYLYYVPYGSLGTGEKYDPLPLDPITDPREAPQPVLRPSQ